MRGEILHVLFTLLILNICRSHGVHCISETLSFTPAGPGLKHSISERLRCGVSFKLKTFNNQTASLKVDGMEKLGGCVAAAGLRWQRTTVGGKLTHLR